MRLIKYAYLTIFFILLGCKISQNNPNPPISISPISIIPNTNINILIQSPINNTQPLFFALKNPSLFLDINGNLSYSGMQLSNYYILQSSIDLINWTNTYIFYNETNKQIDLTKDYEFFRLKVIDATSVHLSWIINSDSNIIDHINIYYGNISGQYDHEFNIGNTNETIVTNLTPNIDYFFAVTCSDTLNEESDFSNEVKYNKDILLNLLNFKY